MKEICDKLKCTYQQINVTTQVTSHTKLIKIHMVSNANVIKFLDEFKSLVDDVVVVHFNIPKPQLVILRLKVMPISWQVFITTQGSQINMILATLTNKMKQVITLWFSSTHEKKG